MENKVKVNTIEASKIANVSTTSIIRWIKEGKLKAESRKSGKRKLAWKIEVSVLNNFLKKRPFMNHLSFSSKDIITDQIKDLNEKILNYQKEIEQNKINNDELNNRIIAIQKNYAKLIEHNEKLMEQNSLLQSINLDLLNKVLKKIT